LLATLRECLAFQRQRLDSLPRTRETVAQRKAARREVARLEAAILAQAALYRGNARHQVTLELRGRRYVSAPRSRYALDAVAIEVLVARRFSVKFVWLLGLPSAFQWRLLLANRAEHDQLLEQLAEQLSTIPAHS
jgi:hypothetical protein